MSEFTIRFSHLDHPMLVAGLLVAALAWSVLAYLRICRGRGSATVWVLPALRFLAIATAIVLILRPRIEYEIVPRKDARIAVLIDATRSMATRDSVGGEARLESALRVATSEGLERLRAVYTVEFLVFGATGDTRPWTPARGGRSPPEGAEALAADREPTDILGALEGIPRGGAPLAAVLLLSDGRQTGGKARSTLEARESPSAAPVYPVALGSGGATVSDVSWAAVASERHALVGNRVEIEGRLRFLGAPSAATVIIRLEGKEISRQELRRTGDETVLRSSVVPDRAGECIYSLECIANSTDDVPENDVTHLVIDVRSKRLELLFLEGRARWQYKFVRRALERDPSVNATGLITLAEGVRLEQGRPPLPLERGLPSSREAWRAFACLIVGNVVEEELSPGDAERIVQWVNEDAGGIVFAGGRESWSSLAKGSLRSLLPLSGDETMAVDGDLRIVLPPASLGHPITRGLERLWLPLGEAPAFGLESAFRGLRSRPGTEILLDVEARPPPRDEGAATPSAARVGDRSVLLAVRQCGRGRSLAWLTESDWRWTLDPEREDGDRLFATLWGRMVRWVAGRDAEGNEGPRVRLARKIVRVGDEVGVEVEGFPDAAGLRVESVGGGGDRVAIAGGSEGSKWSGSYRPRVAGIHSIEARAGESSASAKLVVERDAREMEDRSPDPEMLHRLAEATGGRVLTLAQAGALGEIILRDTQGLPRRVTLGLERSWPVFFVTLGLLALEWGLRRRFLVI